MQNVGETCGRIRGKNTSFPCCENKWTWCGKGYSLKTLVARAKLRTQRSGSPVNWCVNAFSIANSPPYVFKDRDSVRRPYTQYYQFNIIVLSFTFLTIFIKLWGNVAPIRKKVKVPQMPTREANRDKALVGSCREDALWQNLQRKLVTMPAIYEWTNGNPMALMQATKKQSLK